MVLESNKAKRIRLQKQLPSSLCDNSPALAGQEILDYIPGSFVDFWMALGPKKLHLSDGNLSPLPSMARSGPVIEAEDP